MILRTINCSSVVIYGMKKPTKKKKKRLVKELQEVDNRFINSVINGFQKLFSPY